MRLLPAACLIFSAAAISGCGSRQPPETVPPAPQPGPATAASPPIPTEVPAPAGRWHTVQPGDTLWSLARRYGVTVEAFVGANDLADPDELAVGDRLLIPTTATDLWAWPVAGGAILSSFGARRGGRVHRGVDIDARAGQPVVAAWPGMVVFAGGGMRDYGKAVIIDHGRGLTSLYGHNSELLVREGERVGRGQPIALAGDSGNADGVHCHFEVRRDAVALDPLQFFGQPAGR